MQGQARGRARKLISGPGHGLFRVDPSRSESIRVDPSRFESIRVDPSRSESIRVDPSRSESIRVDSSRSESIRVGPQRTQLSGAAPRSCQWESWQVLLCRQAWLARHDGMTAGTAAMIRQARQHGSRSRGVAGCPDALDGLGVWTDPAPGCHGPWGPGGGQEGQQLARQPSRLGPSKRLRQGQANAACISVHGGKKSGVQNRCP
jgi:hypothetical protein